MKFVSSEFGITRNVPLNSKVLVRTETTETPSNNEESNKSAETETTNTTEEKTE